jgi:hypothetical protein
LVLALIAAAVMLLSRAQQVQRQLARRKLSLLVLWRDWGYLAMGRVGLMGPRRGCLLVLQGRTVGC